VYWFVGTAIVLAGSALADRARDRQAYVRKVLRRVLAVTIVVVFVVGVNSLPLVLEIALVGAAIVFTGVQVVAQHDSRWSSHGRGAKSVETRRARSSRASSSSG